MRSESWLTSPSPTTSRASSVSGPSAWYSTRCIVSSRMRCSGVPLNFSNMACRAQCPAELGVLEVGLRRVDDDAAPTEVDEDVDHPRDVLEVVGAAEVDEDVVRLVEAAGRD